MGDSRALVLIYCSCPSTEANGTEAGDWQHQMKLSELWKTDPEKRQVINYKLTPVQWYNTTLG